jgi:predicted transcriptional regulator
MSDILTPDDMAALNAVRANPKITTTQLQRALGLDHKGQAARLMARLQSFGFVERRSVNGARRSSRFHHQAKAAA